MQIRIVLDKRYQTKNGYPIKVRFYHKGRQKLLDTGYRSKVKDWSGSRPKRSHPDYFMLTDSLMELERHIHNALYKARNMDEAIAIVFNKESSIFFEDGRKIEMKNSKNKSIYETALKSFNSLYPNCRADEITKKMVSQYMDIQLTYRFLLSKGLLIKQWKY